MKNAVCLIGNSSSFIREGSFLGTPAVIVGDRQQGREHGDNVVFSSYDRETIVKQALTQIEHGKYASDMLFGSGDAGEKIAESISSIKLDVVKKFID